MNRAILILICLFSLEMAWANEANDAIYPEEIKNCEPCKRLWLANHNKKDSQKSDGLGEEKVREPETSKTIEKAPASTAVVYPKEIENCEPCKHLWLVNRKKLKNNTAE